MSEYYSPTLQTKFGKEGNCLSACIATLYPVDINEVPLFSDDDLNWVSYFSSWFQGRFNKFVITVRVLEDDIELFKGSLVIASILSPHPEVERHAVITKGGKIVFDPMAGEVNIPLRYSDDPVFLIIGDYK